MANDDEPNGDHDDDQRAPGLSQSIRGHSLYPLE